MLCRIALDCAEPERVREIPGLFSTTAPEPQRSVLTMTDAMTANQHRTGDHVQTL
ncbi:hypothetical protein GCM10010946_11510 [Undibacterium squillarum]|uniref:Uncharacterized protein n=1 Tax=Undibacterium squillarum TaxID=1131567 RepID=A0ABQ2XXH4_9BURK|nr:hypothetical protein GCM10010946_11510 [Undibacterium squillarum]